MKESMTASVSDRPARPPGLNGRDCALLGAERQTVDRQSPEPHLQDRFSGIFQDNGALPPDGADGAPLSQREETELPQLVEFTATGELSC
jgi:hypothetical protein